MGTKDREKERIVVGTVGDLPEGSRVIVNVGGRSIGVFNVKGRYFAIRNSCPHQFAPLCLGTIVGTTLPSRPGEYVLARKGEIIRCPWHGWEFDITTGRSIFNPHRTRVRSYDVQVEPGCGNIDAESVESFPVVVEAAEVVLYA